MERPAAAVIPAPAPAPAPGPLPESPIPNHTPAHRGCFADGGPAAALDRFSGWVGSVDECARLAHFRGDAYFGVRDRHYCMTGKRLPTVASTECGVDGRGGTSALSVYETARYFTDARSTALVGCYAYDPKMPHFRMTLGRYPSVLQAAKQAVRNGFEVFGVHDNGVASAGRQPPERRPVATPAPGGCEAAAVDQFGYNMGGPNTIAVYWTERVLSDLLPPFRSSCA